MSTYTEVTRRDILTPDRIDELKRAIRLLQSALPAMREAVDIIAPVQHAMDRAMLDVDLTNKEYDAVRDGTPYGEALDLAFEVVKAGHRIERGTP